MPHDSADRAGREAARVLGGAPVPQEAQPPAAGETHTGRLRR
jgi:hypothetical protein